jgi:hydroxymethylpyrimidine pyrophosphatase-like HAD family hydrolase
VRKLIEPLSLKLPIGTFNCGAIVRPDFKVIEQHLVPEAAARSALDVLAAFGADVWVFATDQWLVRNPTGDYVPQERQTLQAQPFVVDDFGRYLARAAKIVGSSVDFARLTECEAAMREALAEKASVVRSQPYYLDVTAPDVDKGTVVDVFPIGSLFHPQPLPCWAIWKTISRCSERPACRLPWEMQALR